MKHVLVDLLKDIWMLIRQVLYILHCLRVRWSYRILKHKQIENPVHPIWVDPKNIHYVVSGKILPTSSPFSLDRSLAGDWDLGMQETQGLFGDLGELPAGIVPIAQTDIHDAFVQHFMHGIPWEDTAFFSRVSQQIAAGKRKWRCASPTQLSRRLQGVDRLYDRIKSEGYRSQIELGTPRYWDEVRLAIGRNGDLILFDGRHRLSMAKIMQLSKIPAIVSIRHPQWNGDLQTIQQLYGKNCKSEQVQ